MIEKLTLSKRLRRMFDGSLHAWEDWMLAALAFAAVSAVAVVVATQRVIKLTRVELEASRTLTEELRTKNLELEAQIAPRRLADTQQEEIAASLRRFENKVVSLESYGLDAEGAVLGLQVQEALQKGGIRVTSSLMTRQSAGSIALGVQVGGKDEALIESLLAAFTRANIESSRETVPTGGVNFEIRAGALRSGVPADATVFVGVKPIKR
jgi:hypothetical protein